MTTFAPLATAVGLKALPLVSLAINTVNPSFEVGEEAVRLRVILVAELTGRDIAQIGYSRLVGHHLDLIPRQGAFRYGVVFWSEPDARRALLALADLGAPLEDAARRFLEGAEPQPA